MRRFRMSYTLVVLMLCTLAGRAQFAGEPAKIQFHDTSMLKPPPGSKVAVIVFEDLGCPACARAHPIEDQVAAKTHVALVRHDFPLEAHIWTFQGAVCARYIQEKISPRLADAYRSDVFASQRTIAGKDDLDRFTRAWLAKHGLQMPFVMDPGGTLAKEVRADYDLGIRLGVRYTPTVVVVTQNRYQVVCGGSQDGPNDPDRLLPVVEAALAQTHSQRWKSQNEATPGYK